MAKIFESAYRQHLLVNKHFQRLVL